jgi:apolipoprotein N-acyltransferase
MSASDWPDWLRSDRKNNFPPAFRLIVSAITGAGLALSFTWLYFPVYAWVSIGLLLMMVLGAKPRVAYFCGFYHAIAFVFASLSWIAEVLAVHGGTSRLVGWGILLLIAMAWGVLTGGFTWTVNRIARRSVALACIAAPFVWVTSEFARAHLPEIGFPWNLLGYSAAANPALLQIATVRNGRV